MELGNMVFGNSRGEYQIERDNFEGIFSVLLDALDAGCYGAEFENDTFSMFPYYWGDCTCGFDDNDNNFTEQHRDTCYQIELRNEMLAAGGKLDMGYIGSPDHLSYDEWNKVKDCIYHKLINKYGLPYDGCAVHCTCDYDQRYGEWLNRIGYPDGHTEDCLLNKPNFVFKPTGLEIDWYKYPFRDSYSNKPFTIQEFNTIIQKCLKSLGKGVE